MSVAIQTIEIRQGEDVRQAFSVVAGVDVSDWSTWSIALYVHDSAGAIVTAATCTTAGGKVVKTATGEFYFYLTRTVTNAMTRGLYFWQVRRIDTDYDTALAEGKLELKPYTD